MSKSVHDLLLNPAVLIDGAISWRLSRRASVVSSCSKVTIEKAVTLFAEGGR